MVALVPIRVQPAREAFQEGLRIFDMNSTGKAPVAVKAHERKRQSGNVLDVVPEGTPTEVVEHRLLEPEYREALKLRHVWCEGSFSAQKREHNLARVLRRGSEAAEDHCLLSATALNLKRTLVGIFFCWRDGTERDFVNSANSEQIPNISSLFHSEQNKKP